MKEKTKLIISVLVIILIIAVVFVVQKRQEENQQSKVQAKLSLIESIQEKVQLIDLEKNYQIKTLNNEQFLGQMTDGGGQLIGYFKDGKLYKITEKLGLSYCVKTFEYYFSNGQLILVNEKEEDFPDIDNSGTLDYTKLDLAFEGHYYFSQEKLVDMQVIGKKRFSEDSKIDIEAYFLKASKENIDFLVKAN